MSFEPMPEDLARTLVKEAHAAAPYEMCGFVIAGWSFLPMKNCHPDPERHFSMEEDAMLKVLKYNADKVAGIYHSHPRGSKGPSNVDVGLMRNYDVYGFRFWIVTYNNVYEWRIEDDEPRPVRRDGTAGSTNMAYPVLAPATPI